MSFDMPTSTAAITTPATITTPPAGQEARRKEALRPTWFGRAIVYFPTTQLAAVAAIAVAFAKAPSVWQLAALLFAIYGYPVLAFRLMNRIVPLVEGRSIIPNGRFPPWWGSFHVQRSFLALPWLEAALRLVPGLFSLWLRLWGSRIGKGVYWPPEIEIADRSLLEVGHGAVFGHRSGYYCHVLSPTKDGRLLVYVKKIRIGNFAFIGSGSRLGPGTVIEDRQKLDVLTDLFINGRPRSSESPEP